MGKRGPKRTPTALLKLHGSPLAKSRERTEPKPSPGRPLMPRWLDRTAAAKWKRLVPDLDAAGLLDRIDQGALARYCVTWSLWRKAVKQAEGSVTVETTNSRGYTHVHINAALKAAKSLAEDLTKLEDRFGLTPSARASLKVEPRQEGEDESPFARRAGKG